MLGRYVRIARREGLAAANRRAADKVFRMSLRVRREWLETAARRRPPTVRCLYGVRPVGNGKDATFRMCLFGSYGVFLSDFPARQKSPFVFLDIGANQGLYAILAARNRHCVAVHAFAPVPQVAALLAQNVALNRAPQVVVHRYAISDRSGSTEISFDPDHTGTSSPVRADAKDAMGLGTVLLETIDHSRLDALIPTDGPGIPIKIDVEGHETTVVSELAKCRFLPRVEAVFYECDESATDVAAGEATLRGVGFARFDKIGMGRHYDTLAQRPAA